MADLDLIKSKLSIVDVVSPYVKLKKTGKNYKGLCPFHQEKTPSFIVSPDKDIAYCFGCRRGGDIFAFIQEVERIEFPDALRLLAQQAGVELSAAPLRAASDTKDVLYAIQETAADYYQSLLCDHMDAAHARDYIKKRGVSTEGAGRFRIGYSLPVWDGLVRHLSAQGYSAEQMVAAGAALRRDRHEDGLYDRFRGRVMFPLYNSQGRIVGFSGRSLTEREDEPKYINSSDTPIFSKSSVLYGFPAAREKMRDGGCALFVEGQMDVIALHEAGWTNAVATSGTALTVAHLSIIKRFTSHIRFAFDRDRAGIEATKRALELAAHHEITASVVTWDGAKDPDELVRTNPDAWKDRYEHALDPVTYYCDICYANADLGDLAMKQSVTRELFTYLAACVSEVEREHHLHRMCVRLGTSVPVMEREFERFRSGSRMHRTVERHSQEDAPALRRDTEDYLLGLMLEHPVLIPEFRNNCTGMSSFSSRFARIYALLESHYTMRSTEFKLNDFLAGLQDRSIAEYAALASLLAEEGYGDLTEQQRVSELHDLITRKHSRHARTRMTLLTHALKEAEGTGDTVSAQRLLREKRDFIAHLDTASS